MAIATKWPFGGAQLAFIPDVKIIGTYFVNAVANALSTMCQNAQLHLMPHNGASFGKLPFVSGALPVTDTDWGAVVALGAVAVRPGA
jgi:hypothetical protein